MPVLLSKPIVIVMTAMIFILTPVINYTQSIKYLGHRETQNTIIFNVKTKESPAQVIIDKNNGKSTWIRQLVIFLKKYRTDIKIIYIDFKRLDAAPFKEITYLGKTIDEAHFLLQLLCKEVDRRIDILEKAKCFKASEYKGNPPIYPMLWIIDELAELEDKDSQKMLNHLVRIGRATGVHGIVSLQRPSHTTYKNFTDSRSQFPARLCFKMAEKIDSEIVLGKGNTKAYDIKKQGRAIWQFNDEQEIQSLYINNKELLSMVDEIKQEGGERIVYEQQQNLWLQP